MNGTVDEKHGGIMRGIPRMSTSYCPDYMAVQRARALPRMRHNASMSQETVKTTDIPMALRRVLADKEPLLKSMNNWSVISGVGRTTGRDALKAGNNTTLETLQKLAAGAQLTLAEMLEYGDPDWESKVAARRLLMEMAPEEVAALRTLLSARKEKERDGKLPPDAGASEASG